MALGTSARYLLGRTDDPEPPAYPDADERLMLAAFRKLPPNGRQSFLEMIQEAQNLHDRVT